MSAAGVNDPLAITDADLMARIAAGDVDAPMAELCRRYETWIYRCGRQDRGVFQAITRMAAYGGTIVTTGTEVTDGVVREQFFVSPDGGRSWQLAPARTVSGQSPLGFQAARVAGGPRGWVAIATGAPWGLWTSPNGREMPCSTPSWSGSRPASAPTGKTSRPGCAPRRRPSWPEP